MEDIGAWLEDVTDRRHLIRERALMKLRTDMQRKSWEGAGVVAEHIRDRLKQADTWEGRTGLFLASKELLKSETSGEWKRPFAEQMISEAMQGLVDAEVRLRSASGELLGSCGLILGAEAWKKSSDSLLMNIERNIQLDEKQRHELAAKVVESTPGLKKSTNLVHESEGWRNLDTSLSACVHLSDACGKEVMADANVAKLLEHALHARQHPNRFIRETSLKLLTSLIIAASASDKMGLTKSAANDIAPKVADSIAVGLQDNWSQVRYASSVCVRELFIRTDEHVKEKLYGLLIPRMCLNRHYVAEGVRIYSQETWKNVLGPKGRTLLVEYFDSVIEYYELQCDADNHAVREAACQGLAELSTRIEENVVRPKVQRILGALLTCFKDESWPVRDCASTASATITVKFPEEAEGSKLLEELVTLWSTHIGDNIPSVRENAAIALATAAGAYGEDHPVCGLRIVQARASEMMKAVYNQAQDSSRYGTLGSESQYGASHKLARDNDAELHTGQTMYSCGSLAPKMRKGGCMDHGFVRQQEPWEITDGGLRLWRRLMKVSPSLGSELVEDVSKLACSEFHFAHAPYLLETLWYQIQGACEDVDEDRLLEVLPQLAVAVRKSESSGHKLTEAAASEAERALSRKLGSGAIQAALATSA